MFCPNCGTKNDDSAVKCTQCGFDQKSSVNAPQFKGTVMLHGSDPPPNATAAPGQVPGARAPSTPAPRTSSSSPPRANVPSGHKGTMVGVAPPGLEDIRKQAEALNAAKKNRVKKPAPVNLKGTMVGVAPPGLEEARAQVAHVKATAAKQAGPPRANTLATTQPLSGSSPLRASPQVTTSAATQIAKPSGAIKPNLKGTMVGMAPPELQDLRRQIGTDGAATGQALPGQALPGQASPGQTSPGHASPENAGGQVPSHMKGTMIGMAPPSMAAQIAAAKKSAETAAQTSAPANTPAADDELPGSEPDPLGGTVVGTSPFVTPAGSRSPTTEGGPGIAAVPAIHSPESLGATHPQTPLAPVASAPVASALDQAGQQLDSEDRTSEGFAQDAPLPGTLPQAPYGSGSTHQGTTPTDNFSITTPLQRSSRGPIAVIAILVVVIFGGIAFLVGGGDKDEDAVQDEAATEGETAAEIDAEDTPSAEEAPKD